MSDDQAAGQAVISATGIIKHYEGGLIKALDGVNLTVRAGEFIAVCGPSGCGKSTLLNVISGVDRPDAGRIVVSGRNLTSLAPSALDGYRARVIGLVFQLHNLLPNLTALENVQVPMLSTRIPAAERVSWARELLARVGLDDREYARPPTLSGGERQRVAIARALANKPEILLADEPTGALDSKSSERLMSLLESLQHDSGTTLVVVTHEPGIAERAERVAHMLDGRIVSDD